MTEGAEGGGLKGQSRGRPGTGPVHNSPFLSRTSTSRLAPKAVQGSLMRREQDSDKSLWVHCEAASQLRQSRCPHLSLLQSVAPLSQLDRLVVPHGSTNLLVLLCPFAHSHRLPNSKGFATSAVPAIPVALSLHQARRHHQPFRLFWPFCNFGNFQHACTFHLPPSSHLLSPTFYIKLFQRTHWPPDHIPLHSIPAPSLTSGATMALVPRRPQHRIDIIPDLNTSKYFAVTKVISSRRAYWSHYLPAFGLLNSILTL